MTARLPTVGGDSGNWGEILNTYLEVGHTDAGLNTGALVETVQSSNYTLTTTDNGTRIVCTSPITISLPSVGTLQDGFECELVNDSGSTVTIDGAGSSSVTMDDGDVACVLEANSKQRVVKGASTLVS